MTGTETEIATVVHPTEQETTIIDKEDMQEDMKEITETERKGADTIPTEEGVHEVVSDLKELGRGEGHPHVQNRAQDLQATLPHLRKQKLPKKS